MRNNFQAGLKVVILGYGCVFLFPVFFLFYLFIHPLLYQEGPFEIHYLLPEHHDQDGGTNTKQEQSCKNLNAGEKHISKSHIYIQI